MTEPGVLRYQLEGDIPSGRAGVYVRKAHAAFLRQLKRDKMETFESDADGWQYCRKVAVVRPKRKVAACPRCGYRRGDA